MSNLVQNPTAAVALAQFNICKTLSKNHRFPFKHSSIRLWEESSRGQSTGHAGKLALLIKNEQGEDCNVLWLKPDYDNLENVGIDYLPLALNGNYVQLKGDQRNAGSILVTPNPMTAIALNEVTGYGVACTLKPHNMADVIKAINARNPRIQFVICDDTPCFLGYQDYWAELKKLPQVCFLTPPQKGFYEKTQSNPQQLKAEIEKILACPTVVDDDDICVSFAIPQHSMARVGSETLFAQVTNIVLRYVSMPTKMAPILAAYIYATYLCEELGYAPLLGILSPEKRCGKSTLLKLLTALVNKPARTDNITPAALCNLTAKDNTVLIDEFDTFCKKSKDLIGIINGGVYKDGVYSRIGKNGLIIESPTYGSKVYAMIGTPSETILDRSIGIILQRKLATEIKETLTDTNTLRYLQQDIAQWCQDHKAVIAANHGKVAKLVADNDRQADNYHVLLRIAARISEEAETAVREAAADLIKTLEMQESVHSGENLLRDIKLVFENSGVDRISSSRLIEELGRLPDSVWRNYESNRPIETHHLAQALKLFKVAPKTIRIAGQPKPLKGYRLDMFEDAFARYCAQAVSQ
jgi:Protein of unknown function (DUF3631)